MNTVNLIGRMTKDVQLTMTESGREFVRFTLAVSRRKTANNQNPEADFITCVAWQHTAKAIAQYCGKGSKIAIEGAIQTRSYNDQYNNRVYRTEVVVSRMHFLDSKPQSQQRQIDDGWEQGVQEYARDNMRPTAQQYQAEAPLTIDNDDLPF